MHGTHDGVTVLVIEDEESYRQALDAGLSLDGFTVVLAEDGGRGLQRFEETAPDIVLLDANLPDMKGIDVCRRIQAVSDVPVIMISAANSELDVVLGLELGAAGYVAKPFGLRELVARMDAILRRVGPTVRPATPGAGPGPVEPGEDEVFTLGDVRVDLGKREVVSDGEVLHLSRKEFDLLAVLLSPPGRMRTRADLVDRLWPDMSLLDSRTLDTHVHRLRSKLEPDPTAPRYLITVRGVGFRIDDAVPAASPVRVG